MGRSAPKVDALPEDEQDAIAAQILTSLSDEREWKLRFQQKRDVIRRIAREALKEDAAGESIDILDDTSCSGNR